MSECPQFLAEITQFLPLFLLLPHPLPQDLISSLEYANHTWNLSPNHHPDQKWILLEIKEAVTLQGHIKLEQRGKRWVERGLWQDEEETTSFWFKCFLAPFPGSSSIPDSFSILKDLHIWLGNTWTWFKGENKKAKEYGMEIKSHSHCCLEATYFLPRECHCYSFLVYHSRKNPYTPVRMHLLVSFFSITQTGMY